MFMDEALDTVGFESTWRKSHKLTRESTDCQTEPIGVTDAEVQTVRYAHSATQTEPHQHLTAQLLSQDLSSEWPGLRDFLSRVEERVIKVLVQNIKSHAFDGLRMNCIEQNQTVSHAHRLQDAEALEQRLQVSSVSWNCTGAVVACAFGRVDDGDWSTEKAYVCTWNLERRGLNPSRPDLRIDAGTPVMSLCFHPLHPSLIAGGLYSGEVVVWDTSRTQEPVLAQTGISDQTHREPVFQVHWVPGPRQGELCVLSVGSEGRVLLWAVDGSECKLTLSTGYAVLTQQLPHSSSRARGNSNVGLTAIALSPWDLDSFLLGSEGGLLLKCSFSSQTVATVPPDGEGVSLRAPAQFSFRPRSGPIHSLHYSPFHRNLFLSVGTDGLAVLHSVLQAVPLLCLRVSDAYVFGVRWSPTRPLVFAAVTGQGLVQIFDLGRRSLRPAATIDQGTGGPAHCLEFNPSQPHLLAVGNADGSVNIWQLSSELSEQHSWETATLEQLANEVAD